MESGLESGVERWCGVEEGLERPAGEGVFAEGA